MIVNKRLHKISSSSGDTDEGIDMDTGILKNRKQSFSSVIMFIK